MNALEITASDDTLKETKNVFLDAIVEQMAEQLADTELVAALAALDLTKLDEEWNEFKEGPVQQVYTCLSAPAP